MDLRSGDTGTMLLPAGTRIMEIKTARAIPLWLIRAIESLGIHPVSLSKVGTAYQELQNHPSFPLRMAV
ncbi:MAG: hypothetical protein IJ242_08965 [Clostridia bacterium]|nr:hypothetical protein [Clostridia bacterium]